MARAATIAVTQHDDGERPLSATSRATLVEPLPVDPVPPGSTETDLWRVAGASAGCLAIFLLDLATAPSPIATQLYPAVFAALYGARSRRTAIVFWVAAVALIGAGASPWTLGGLDAGGRALSVVMVSLAAIVSARQFDRESSLRRAAVTDPLTGVLNRRSFQEITTSNDRRARRGGTTFAVLMIDIDHFKRINDTYGHPAGDAVIRELADVARRTLRPSDVIARYGGEEFVISLPDTERDAAMVVAHRLRAAVEESAVISDAGAIRFTVSVGVAIGSRGTPMKEAISLADKALYAAKANGRNRVELGLATGSSQTERSAAEGSSEATTRAARRILVVDDDDDIRSLLVDCLKRDGGYAVSAAANGVEALRILEGDASVSLLLTDIVMPGELDGFALGRRARGVRPDMKVVYMSGYVGSDRIATTDESENLLQKPFRMAQMLEAIDAALRR